MAPFLLLGMALAGTPLPLVDQPGVLPQTELDAARAATRTIWMDSVARELIASGTRDAEYPNDDWWIPAGPYALFGTPWAQVTDRVAMRDLSLCHGNQPGWRCLQMTSPAVRLEANGQLHFFVFNARLQHPEAYAQEAVRMADYFYSTCFLDQVALLGVDRPLTRGPLADVTVETAGGSYVSVGHGWDQIRYKVQPLEGDCPFQIERIFLIWKDSQASYQGSYPRPAPRARPSPPPRAERALVEEPSLLAWVPDEVVQALFMVALVAAIGVWVAPAVITSSHPLVLPLSVSGLVLVATLLLPAWFLFDGAAARFIISLENMVPLVLFGCVRAGWLLKRDVIPGKHQVQTPGQRLLLILVTALIGLNGLSWVAVAFWWIAGR